MRICHINLAKEFTPAEQQTELLVRALDRQSIEQSVLIRANSPLLFRLADLGNIDFRQVRSPGILKYSHCQNCDIVHAHEINGAVLAYSAHKRYGTPFALTSRHFSKPDSHPLAKKIFANADLVFALSHQIEGILKDYNPLLNTQMIPPMCSHYKITESFRHLNSRYVDRFVVGHIHSKTEGHRGIINLIKAAHQLAKKHSDMHFVFLGSDKNHKNIKALAANASYLEFPELKRNVGDYLNCFNLFISPSEKDNLRTSLVDAMEQGTAVITTKTGNAKDLIQDEVNGLLVSLGDEKQLIDAITRAYENPTLRERLMIESQQQAKQYFPEKLAEQYYSGYKSLLAQ